jgi:hypothetical protein
MKISEISNWLIKKMYDSEIVGENILITSDWTEILPQQPLKIKKRFQRISMRILCEQNLDQEENIWFLEDGTVINPQVEIVDEFGNTYELEGGQAGVIPKNSEIIVASSLGFSCKSGGLPENRTYTKIRVRNNQTFLCPKIIWLNYEMK